METDEETTKTSKVLHEEVKCSPSVNRDVSDKTVVPSTEKEMTIGKEPTKTPCEAKGTFELEEVDGEKKEE